MRFRVSDAWMSFLRSRRRRPDARMTDADWVRFKNLRSDTAEAMERAATMLKLNAVLAAWGLPRLRQPPHLLYPFEYPAALRYPSPR
jgi:hypothetical protein